MRKKKESTAKKPSASTRKFNQELPAIAKKYNIRVSSPFGYYPEDVNRVLEKLEQSNNILAKENAELTKKYEAKNTDYKNLRTEFTNFKLEVSKMQLESTSFDESLAKINRGFGQINEKNETKPAAPSEPKLKIKPLKLSSPSSDSGQSTFNNLISPKKD